MVTFLKDRKYEYIRDTRILALHIAAAAGTAPSNIDAYRLGLQRASEIFRLRPEDVAMYHNNLDF